MSIFSSLRQILFCVLFLYSFAASAQDEIDDAFDDGRSGNELGVNIHLDLASVIAGDFAISVDKEIDLWTLEGGAGVLLGWRLHNPLISYTGLTVETLDKMEGGYSLLASFKKSMYGWNTIIPHFGLLARQRVYNFSSTTASDIGFSKFKVTEVTVLTGARFDLNHRFIGTASVGAGYVFGNAFADGSLVAGSGNEYRADGIAYYLRLKLGYRL